MVSRDTDLFELTDMLIALEKEKIEKNTKSDQLINFNDEIISIEEIGMIETTDISTSGDNLFYCNNILTKNSFGVPATADLMLAFITTEQLEKMNQLMVKQLKNRYNDVGKNKRFTVGIERSKMRLYDIDDPLSNIASESKSEAAATKTPFDAGRPERKKFTGFKT